MSQFWLNVDAVRMVQRHLDQNWIARELGADLPHPAMDENDLCWLYCPNCLWCFIGSRVFHRGDRAGPLCPRPTHEPNIYGIGAERSDLCWIKYPGIRPREFPAEIEAALWSAFRLNKSNAVVEMLASMRPEQVGLPDAVTCHRLRKRGLGPIR